MLWLTSYDTMFVSFFRTLSNFEVWIKKGGKSTDYYLPTEILVMINTVLDYKNQVYIHLVVCDLS